MATENKKSTLLNTYGKGIIRTQMIEIIIPKNNNAAPKTVLEFPDVQNIRNSYLYYLKAFCVDDLAKSPLTKATVISAQLMKSIFVSLQGYNGKIFCSQKPLVSFRTSQYGRLNVDLAYETNPTYFSKQKMNYPKSQIEIADSSLIDTREDQSILLEITYSRFADVEKKARAAGFRNQS